MNEIYEYGQGGASPEAINAIRIARLFADSYVEVFKKMGSKLGEKFSVAPTFTIVKAAETRHKVTSLLDFTGAINGFVILNYSSDAALDVVSVFLQGMGMSKEDCPKFVGEDAANTLGEITNQVLGGFRRNLEKTYGMKSSSGTPITMIMNTMFNLAPVDHGIKHVYVRVQINTPSANAVYVEFCMQEGIFVRLKSK